MVPRLRLNAREQQAAISLLSGYLEDGSSIVKTFALQGLADISETEPSFRGRVVEILGEAARKGTPAMKARSRKLLRHLGCCCMGISLSTEAPSLRLAGSFDSAQGRLASRRSPHGLDSRARLPLCVRGLAKVNFPLALGVLVTKVHCSGDRAPIYFLGL
jgi:hypothetical protein